MIDHADTIGEYISKTMPTMPTRGSIDLDTIAMRGRLHLWQQSVRELDDRFHPSSLSDPCMRFDVVRLMVVKGLWDYDKHDIELRVGKPTPDPSLFDYNLQRKFDIGTALHKVEQDWYFGGRPGQLVGRWVCRSCGTTRWSITTRPTPCTNSVTVRREDGILVDERQCSEQGQTWEYKEVYLFDKELNISAKVDLPLLVRDSRSASDHLVIADLKTLGAGRWDRLIRYNRPFPKDENQVKIYLILCRRTETFPIFVREGALRYIHQGDADAGSRQFVVPYDRKMESWLYSYINTVNDIVEQRVWELSSCVCQKPTQARAKRCPLRPLCFR